MLPYMLIESIYVICMESMNRNEIVIDNDIERNEIDMMIAND